MNECTSRAALGLLSLLAISPIAAQQSSPPQQSPDSFVWLEDVEGQRSMEWVNAHNAATIAALTRSPLYQSFYARIKQILDSKDKIANPEIIGNSLYNFWQDAEHERGIWRRTNWASFATANPTWETVIDLDSLSKAEGVTWSWGGGDCFEPEYRRCIVALSRGGSDRIANPEIIGNSLYNFWQDAEHERGIWRRTNWASFATANPTWETVIDLDSLSKAEGVTWSWGGGDCFEPEYRRCIVALSRGGSDAAEIREFD